MVVAVNGQAFPLLSERFLLSSGQQKRLALIWVEGFFEKENLFSKEQGKMIEVKCSWKSTTVTAKDKTRLKLRTVLAMTEKLSESTQTRMSDLSSRDIAGSGQFWAHTNLTFNIVLVDFRNFLHRDDVLRYPSGHVQAMTTIKLIPLSRYNPWKLSG